MATWKTVTVGSTGDYATLNAAQGGEATDVTAQTGDLVISCHAFEDTTAVLFSSTAWVTDSTHRVIVEAADNHLGGWSTGAYRLSVAGTVIRNVTVDNLYLRGLQVRETGTAGTRNIIELDAGLGTGQQDIEKCIVVMDHADDADTTMVGIKLEDSAQVYKMRNVVLYGGKQTTAGSKGIEVTASAATVYCDNVTIDDWHTGIDLSSGGTFQLRNSRITDCTTIVDEAGGQTLSSGSTHNLTDGSAPTNWGANSYSSTDSPTVNYTNDSSTTLTSRDYHIAAGDSGIGAGISLSGDGNNPFADDIDGDTRS